MKSNIEQKLQEHFPELCPAEIDNDKFSLYKLLNHFGNYCSSHSESDKSQEILNVIDNLYQAKNLFDRNAIENEFLSVITRNLGVSELMHHLKKIPESLWTVYIKVLMETHKDQK